MFGGVGTGSGGSTGREGGDASCLPGGLCVRQKQVSHRDSYIAVEALELLVACLQHRTPLLCEYLSG